MRLHTWNSGVFFFRVQGVTASTVRYDSFLQGVDFYEHKLSFSFFLFFLRITRAAFPRAQSSLKCAPWEAVGYKKKLTLCVLHSFHNGRGSWWVLSTQYMMLPSADRRGKRHKFWIFVALFLFVCVCFLCSCWPNLYSTYSNDDPTGGFVTLFLRVWARNPTCVTCLIVYNISRSCA